MYSLIVIHNLKQKAEGQWCSLLLTVLFLSSPAQLMKQLIICSTSQTKRNKSRLPWTPPFLQTSFQWEPNSCFQSVTLLPGYSSVQSTIVFSIFLVNSYLYFKALGLFIMYESFLHLCPLNILVVLLKYYSLIFYYLLYLWGQELCFILLNFSFLMQGSGKGTNMKYSCTIVCSFVTNYPKM